VQRKIFTCRFRIAIYKLSSKLLWYKHEIYKFLKINIDENIGELIMLNNSHNYIATFEFDKTDKI